MTRASIIIVSYGDRGLLDACLVSALRFVDLARDEIIVVDNGSGDAVTEGLESAYPAVRFALRDDNIGFGRASNHGAGLARGRFLLFLNSDTVVTEDLVTPLVAHVETHPEIAIIAPRLVFPDGRHQPSTHGFPSTLKEAVRLFPGVKNRIQDAGPVRGIARSIQRWLPGNLLARYTPPDGPRLVPEVTGACFLIGREVFDAVGGFDPRYFMYLEEADLCARVAAGGGQICYFPDVSLVHHLSKTSQAPDRAFADRIFLERYRSLFTFFGTHRSRVRTLWLRFVLGVLIGVKLAALAAVSLVAPRLRASLGRLARLWRLCLTGRMPGGSVACTVEERDRDIAVL